MVFYFYAFTWFCSYRHGAPFGHPSGHRSSALRLLAISVLRLPVISYVPSWRSRFVTSWWNVKIGKGHSGAKMQPRSQDLLSYRSRKQARRDPGTRWSRATLNIENIRELFQSTLRSLRSWRDSWAGERRRSRHILPRGLCPRGNLRLRYQKQKHSRVKSRQLRRLRPALRPTLP